MREEDMWERRRNSLTKAGRIGKDKENPRDIQATARKGESSDNARGANQTADNEHARAAGSWIC